MTHESPTEESPRRDHAADGPFLAPVRHPKQWTMRLLYRLLERKFGKTPTWLRVIGPRMPLAFLAWGARPYRLESRLMLPADTALLLRARVAGLNGCAWCLDAERWVATTSHPHVVERLDALDQFRSSPLFNDRERAALAYATELTEERGVDPETFAELRRHFFEREVCEVVWVVASENLANLTNIGLGVGSDGLCDLAGSPRPDRVRSL